MLALGEASAAALARSRTIEALVLKRSSRCQYPLIHWLSEKRTVTGHAGLARNTSGDEDDLRALQSITEARGSRVEASDGAVGVDVAQISSDTCRKLATEAWGNSPHQHTRAATDIIEGEVANTGVKLHEKGQGLANATRSTKDGNLGSLGTDS